MVDNETCNCTNMNIVCLLVLGTWVKVEKLSSRCGKILSWIFPLQIPKSLNHFCTLVLPPYVERKLTKVININWKSYDIKVSEKKTSFEQTSESEVLLSTA